MRTFFLVCLLGSVGCTPPSDVPPLELAAYSPPASVSAVREDVFGPDDELTLSSVPVLDPWSIEVRVERTIDDQQVRIDLVSCLQGEELETLQCRAFYLPARNSIG